MNPACEKLQYKRTSSKVELVLPIIVFDSNYFLYFEKSVLSMLPVSCKRGGRQSRNRDPAGYDLSRPVEVLVQQRTIVGMCALVDDLLCTVAGTFPQVCPPYSDTMIFTECSLWSSCVTLGTMQLMAPFLAVEGEED